MRTDRWSEMGAEHLGEPNIGWVRRIEEDGSGPAGAGAMMLLKALLNDYWADAPGSILQEGWDREKIDMVMSKLYWCWVEWGNQAYFEAGEEE